MRLGWDENDKSTWEEEYVKMPRHREIPVQDFCPTAWEAMCELVGGEDKIDPVRERYHGDQFIINFGSDYWDKVCDVSFGSIKVIDADVRFLLVVQHESPPPQELTGW